MSSPCLRILLSVLCVACLSCLAPVEVRVRWHVVTSPNFEIFSSLPEARAKELARELERFRALIRILMPDAIVDAPIPTNIYAFDRKSEFHRYATKKRSYAGYFRAGVRRNTIALFDHSSALGASEIVLHEYVHFVVNSSSAKSYPAWYNEGFAELMSTARTHQDMMAVGAVPKSRIPALQFGRWISIEKVISPEAYASFSDEERAMFYAEAWALVHYLTLDRGTNASFSRDLDRYLSLTELGVGPPEAFESAFRESPREVGLAIRRNLERGDLRAFGIPLEKLDHDERDPVVRVPEQDEVSVRLGQIQLSSEQFERAEETFRSAVELNPISFRAQAGLGDAIKSQGRFEEAEPHFRRAVELAPEDVLVQLDLGEFLLERALAKLPSRSGRLADLDEARAIFARLIERDPEGSEARMMLGTTYLLPGEDAALAVEHLELAYARLSGVEDVAMRLVEAHVATNNDRAASRILLRLLASRTESSLDVSVADSIAAIRRQRDERLDRIGAIRSENAS